MTTFAPTGHQANGQKPFAEDAEAFDRLADHANGKVRFVYPPTTPTPDVGGDGRTLDGVLPRGIPGMPRGYAWFLDENLDRALDWVNGINAPGTQAATKLYLTSALLDLVHYDRACRGSSVLPMNPEPIREAAIPTEIRKDRTSRSEQVYKLRRKAFAWTPDTPFEATDGIAKIAGVGHPDKFWIAEYFYDRTITWDPILYAEFGSWLVEIARWD